MSRSDWPVHPDLYWSQTNWLAGVSDEDLGAELARRQLEREKVIAVAAEEAKQMAQETEMRRQALIWERLATRWRTKHS